MRDINVYGFIGKDWYDEDSVSASEFADQLAAADGDDVTVHINSGGGDVFAAHTMAALIGSYRGRTKAVVEGLAASAASYFALTADEVTVMPGALLMVHNPSGWVMGDAAEVRKYADELDKVRGTIADAYVRKTGIDRAEVERLMDEETWFDAAEAVERGFADRVEEGAANAVACVSDRMLATYRHAPEALKGARHADPAATGEAGRTIGPTDEDGNGGAGAAQPGAGAAHVVIAGNVYETAVKE